MGISSVSGWGERPAGANYSSTLGSSLAKLEGTGGDWVGAGRRPEPLSWGRGTCCCGGAAGAGPLAQVPLLTSDLKGHILHVALAHLIEGQ